MRTAGLTVAVALGWTTVTAVSALGLLDPSGPGTASTVHAPTEAPTTDPQARKVDALNRRYGCSATGLEPGVMPARTVVRVGGTVRLATFDEGWAMHVGDVPGTLVSVCRR